MHDVPGDTLAIQERDAIIKDEGDPDVRINQIDEDKMVEPAMEFFDGDKDQDKPDTTPGS
jgi:hypothetical protein